MASSTAVNKTQAQAAQQAPKQDEADAETQEDQIPQSPLRKFWNFIRPIAILVIVLFAVRSSIADWNDVPTGSMIPTILEGDRIFVNKLAYDLKVPFTTWHLATWSAPKRGDICVFFSPEPAGTRLVKRCVGVPGDTIVVRENKLYINGVLLDYKSLNPSADPTKFKYLSDTEKKNMQYFTETLGEHVHPIRENFFNHTEHFDFPRDGKPVQIPPDKYFMMGDNRDNSRDSRWFGFVDRNQIVGRASAVAVSLDLNHYWIPRWSRFFSSLP